MLLQSYFFFLKSKLNVRKVFLQALFCRSQKAFVYAQGDGSEFRVEVYEEVVVEGDEGTGAGELEADVAGEVQDVRYGAGGAAFLVEEAESDEVLECEAVLGDGVCISV